MGRRVINIPKVKQETIDAMVTRFRRFDRVIEVGVGRRPEVAAALTRGATVIVTDIVPRAVPDSVRFVIDDITTPDHRLYADSELVYAINLPEELQWPASRVASRCHSTFVFTTLGAELPVIPVDSEVIPGEILYCADGVDQQQRPLEDESSLAE